MSSRNIAVVLALTTMAAACHGRPASSRQRTASSARGISVQPGDVVFRRTDGLLGTLVTETDRASEYSHVGIIVSADTDTAIVHADPSSELPGGGHVVRASLNSFVNDSNVAGFAVFRLRNRSAFAVARAIEWAVDQARRQVPFDGGLNLADTSKLYCTELVWRAYQRGGVTLVEPSRNRLQLPFGPDTVLLVSALAASPLLERIARRPSP